MAVSSLAVSSIAGSSLIVSSATGSSKAGSSITGSSEIIALSSGGIILSSPSRGISSDFGRLISSESSTFCSISSRFGSSSALLSMSM